MGCYVVHGLIVSVVVSVMDLRLRGWVSNPRHFCSSFASSVSIRVKKDDVYLHLDLEFST